ncbi:MAG: type II secretion system GspH family protein, partial [Candidatus Gastranaerophilales bacterium]|nr:type II secretion system GspH family protein [Candidatus Gastranaerophilales bacterium]
INKLCLSAFTMAEALLVLGIIGVIAVLTLPSTLLSYKAAVYKSSLKKAYAVLQEAVTSMEEDTGVRITHTKYPCVSGDSDFEKVFKTYFLQLENCGRRSCVTNAIKSDESTESGALSDIYKTYNGASDAYSNYFDDGQLIMTSGILVMIESCSLGHNFLLTVDLNGISNKPNKWGHDLFTFEINEDTGRFSPMGVAGTQFIDEDTYCSSTSDSNLNGIGCTGKALFEENYFKKIL